MEQQNINLIRKHSLYPDGVLYEKCGRGPQTVPSRDYYQVEVTTSNVNFRTWKITNNAHGQFPPTEVACPIGDFKSDERLRSLITSIFGESAVEHISRLALGQLDYITRLPDFTLIDNILVLLDLEDICTLSNVSKKMRELCKSERLWKKLYEKQVGDFASDEVIDLADEIGWSKLYFLDKVHLQMALKRRQQVEEMAARLGINEDDPQLWEEDDAIRSAMEKNNSSVF